MSSFKVQFVAEAMLQSCVVPPEMSASYEKTKKDWSRQRRMYTYSIATGKRSKNEKVGRLQSSTKGIELIDARERCASSKITSFLYHAIFFLTFFVFL